MNPKIEITRAILNSLGIDASEDRIRKTIPTWWVNPRKKTKGGLRLTEQGFECFQKADIKAHKVKFEESIHYTNKLIINLDNFIECPWYVNNKAIYVFGDKMAVQLILFSGNIAKFATAKEKSILTKD